MDILLCYSSLDEQPDLSSIQANTLSLHHNNIRTLWDDYFPIGLKELDVGYNSILSDGFPDIFPNTIEKIIADYNIFVDLEDVVHWPANLKHINLSHNPLRFIPSSFPPTLEILNLSYSILEYIDLTPFPALKILNISCTNVNSLHGIIPATLTELFLMECELESLPDLSHTQLKILDCSKNRITQLPALPFHTLTYLNCSWNNITDVVTNLPASLITLVANNNRIRTFYSEPPANLLLANLKHNCLTSIFMTNSVLCTSNWNEEHHRLFSKIIQKAWYIYKMKRAFHIWWHVGCIQKELVKVAVSRKYFQADWSQHLDPNNHSLHSLRHRPVVESRAQMAQHPHDGLSQPDRAGVQSAQDE